jgi:hypothetical protein
MVEYSIVMAGVLVHLGSPKDKNSRARTATSALCAVCLETPRAQEQYLGNFVGAYASADSGRAAVARSSRARAIEPCATTR